jgi:hypothetical protein
VFCTFDADSIFARDGEKDVVDCGGGADQAQVDGLDVVAYCSTVDRPATPAPGPAPAPSPTPQPGEIPAFQTTGRARIATGVPLAVTCPSACQFAVTLKLDARTARRFGLARRAGVVRGSLLQAGRKTARLRLTAKARRRLRRASSVRASLGLKVTDAAGKVTTASKKVTLRR